MSKALINCLSIVYISFIRVQQAEVSTVLVIESEITAKAEVTRMRQLSLSNRIRNCYKISSGMINRFGVGASLMKKLVRLQRANCTHKLM